MRCAVAGRWFSSCCPIVVVSDVVSTCCFGGDGAVAGRPFPATGRPPLTVDEAPLAAEALLGGVLPDAGPAV